jgi:enamine deaminase RidA (YjgF/YER057c/UK114 family)
VVNLDQHRQMVCRDGAASKTAQDSVIKYRKMSAEQRIREAGLSLPEPPAAGGNYVPAKTVGSLVYLSGVISTNAEGVLTGTAGAGCSVEQGQAAARACALVQMAVLRRHLGSLDTVKQIVSVNGYVNAVPGFADSPKVINGASDLLIEVFGEAGRHVRAAIGVSSLPRNALVELQMVVEI